MDLKEHLLAEARRHCAARGISLARLATLVVNDGKFFRRIEAGGDFGTRTYDRFMAYFRAHSDQSEPRERLPLSNAAHAAAARLCGD